MKALISLLLLVPVLLWLAYQNTGLAKQSTRRRPLPDSGRLFCEYATNAKTSYV